MERIGSAILILATIMLSKEAKTELKLEYEDLAVGARVRGLVCPTCRGGDSRERSFTLSMDTGGLWYKCWRASCDEKGFIPLLSSRAGEYVPLKKRKPFTHETSRLTLEQEVEFWQRYGIQGTELSANGVVQCPSRHSFIFPVHNFHGFEIGKHERWYSWWHPPTEGRNKADYYTESEAEIMYFPRDCSLHYDTENCTTLAIVEDALSAIKMNRLMPTCALLGSELREPVFDELRKLPFDKFLLVLDPDAHKKAAGIQEKYGFYKPIEIKRLDKDPKDTPFEELRRAFGA